MFIEEDQPVIIAKFLGSGADRRREWRPAPLLGYDETKPLLVAEKQKKTKSQPPEGKRVADFRFMGVLVARFGWFALREDRRLSAVKVAKLLDTSVRKGASQS